MLPSIPGFLTPTAKAGAGEERPSPKPKAFPKVTLPVSGRGCKKHPDSSPPVLHSNLQTIVPLIIITILIIHVINSVMVIHN